jgi:HAD superfamily hydrolase (TIGR01509 family)
VPGRSAVDNGSVERREVKAVLFDYGFTLVTYRFPAEALIEAMEEVRGWLGSDPPTALQIVQNVLAPIDAQLPELGRSEDEVDYLAFYADGWRRAGFDLPSATLYRILDLECRCWDGTVRLADDAISTLDELARRNLRTAICSNAPFPPEMMHRQLQRVGVADHVDAIVLSSEVGRRKPAPEIYRAALGRLQVEPGQALFVGDQLVEDYQAPRRVGMDAVLCTALARRPPPPGVPVIGSLANLLQCLG